MDSTSTSSSRYAVATVLLIVAVSVARILYLSFWCPLDLAPDEAHYWDWSRHLDWSYYSKGPLVAVLIRLSCWLFGGISVSLTGAEMLAVRLPAVVCGALLLWAVYRLTVEAHGQPKWGFAAVALALTMPLLAVGALIMTIDAPYTCAWAWALVWVHRALFGGAEESGPMHCWVLAGLCVAVGVLAKHTMVLFVPMVGLYLLMQRWRRPADEGDGVKVESRGAGERARNEEASGLRQPGFWVMAGIGALGGLPILFWNMSNGWVTLAHTGGHVGVGRGLQWLGPLRFVSVQAAVLLGYWFVVWAGAIWAYRPGHADRRQAYFWWMSFPMVAFFALFSFKNGGGEPNWPITAYLAGMVLVVPYLAAFARAPHALVRRLTVACVFFFAGLGLTLSIVLLDTRMVRPLLVGLTGVADQQNPTPLRRLDPTCRLKGWQTLAREVDDLRETLTRRGQEPIIAAGSWTVPGQLGFYGKGRPQVYCLGDRHSQYDLWRPNPLEDVSHYQGRTFILVGVSAPGLEKAFDKVEPGRLVVHVEDGQPLAIWHVTVGHGFRGFPPDTRERPF